MTEPNGLNRRGFLLSVAAVGAANAITRLASAQSKTKWLAVETALGSGRRLASVETSVTTNAATIRVE
jgi:hypothetical protein